MVKLKHFANQLRTSERGVSAILVALSMIMIMGFVALGIDFSLHTHERQQLWDTLDAASLAGSQFLPDDPDAAYQAALDYAEANWPGITPDIDFWCVVSVNDSGGPETSQIPAMCDPGPGPYTTATYPDMECNSRLCLIPCNPFTPEFDTCNTIRVRAEADVNYTFAKVVGISKGSTGTLNSASCKGPCGAEIDVPGDIALVLDRTGSMRPQDLSAVKSASRAFLEGLSPSRHQVALGTIGRTSGSPGSCPTTPSISMSSGPWVPIGLTDNYDLTDNDPPDSPPDLNSSSDLVRGINCLSTSSTRTNLGDSIFAAGNYLLNNGRENVPSGVVFMTDGEANQPSSVSNPCDYAESRAQSVKSSGVIVVTIAYRLQGVDCGGTLATTVLANMASDPESGVATADDHGGCVDNSSVAAENSDGDLFFCAPEPGLLSSVFSQASSAILAQFSERTILVKPPS